MVQAYPDLSRTIESVRKIMNSARCGLNNMYVVARLFTGNFGAPPRSQARDAAVLWN